VSVLVPRREYRRFWHRLLHDHTAEQIARAVAQIPHASVTFIPYQLGPTPPPPRPPSPRGPETPTAGPAAPVEEVVPV
jgi:hypothetical protein